MIFDHITQRHQWPVIMLAAKVRSCKDLPDIGKIFDVFIINDRDIIVEGFKRSRKHAAVGEKSQKNNNTDQADIVIEDRFYDVMHEM